LRDCLCISCTTTSAAYTRPCESHLRWKREFQTMFGAWKISWLYWTKRRIKMQEEVYMTVERWSDPLVRKAHYARFGDDFFSLHDKALPDGNSGIREPKLDNRSCVCGPLAEVTAARIRSVRARQSSARHRETRTDGLFGRDKGTGALFTSKRYRYCVMSAVPMRSVRTADQRVPSSQADRLQASD
jgi:hypothetical protein